MNKNGKLDVIVWVLLAIAIIVVYIVITGGKIIPLSQEANPADLTNKKGSGTGIAVSLYNCPPDLANKSIITQSELSQYCTKIAVPITFSSTSTSPVASIVTRTTPITCTSTASCLTSYSTTATASPNLMCYNSQCVLGSVTAISLSIGVTNPASSQITFTSVSPTSVTSTPLTGVWATAMGTMTPQTIIPGQTFTWTGSAMGTSQFGSVATPTTQTFAMTISGTNSYTGAVTTQSSSVALTFAADPTGAFTVIVNSPI